MTPLDLAIQQVEPKPAAYVLGGLANGRHYTGACHDLVQRLLAHHKGKCSRTRNMRPLALVYFEYSADYAAALKREQFLKSGSGRALWRACLLYTSDAADE